MSRSTYNDPYVSGPPVLETTTGIAPNDFLSQLSQHLPNAVNGITPNGRLPDEGEISV